MEVESRMLLLAWLVVMAVSLAVTIGLPAAFTLLTDTAQLLLTAVIIER